MARKSLPPRPKALKLEDRPIPDPLSLHDRVVLHAETTDALLVLIERVAVLRDAGKIAEARKLFRRVERLNERLLKLEDTGPRTPRMH
jgi:hypothetical protein